MEKKTIRLIVPDWQAGDNPVYYFGAKILQVIAPKKEGQKEITIPVPDDFKPLERENGVTAQSAVYQQVKDTVSAIDKEAPDKIITFGGNCLVSQAPFAYLNEKYDDLGVLWVDAHPDISNPEIYENEHAMVLANLLGAGDPKLSGLVRKTLKPSQVRYEGMQGGMWNRRSLIGSAFLMRQPRKMSSTRREPFPGSVKTGSNTSPFTSTATSWIPMISMRPISITRPSDRFRTMRPPAT